MNADVVDKTQPAFPWRRWAGRCALFVVGAMAGLLLAELALRLIGLGYRRPTVSHPYRGIASQPHSVFDYAGEGRSQTIHFNSHGFRDIDRSPAKSAGVYRIAVLGDSYIEAPQVAVTDRVTEQLEAELNRRGVLAPLQVEVLNFGFSAYGTMQELQVLKQDVWQFHPDLVILAFLTGNDVQNNCRELQDERSRPYLELRAGEFQESSRRVPGEFPAVAGNSCGGRGGPPWRLVARITIAGALEQDPIPALHACKAAGRSRAIPLSQRTGGPWI